MSELDRLIARFLAFLGSLLKRGDFKEVLRNIYTITIPFSTTTTTLIDIAHDIDVHSIRLVGDLYTDDSTDIWLGGAKETYYGTFEMPVYRKVGRLKIAPSSWGGTRTGLLFVTYEGAWIKPTQVGLSRTVERDLAIPIRVLDVGSLKRVYGSVNNATVVLYTVPSGKAFYVYHVDHDCHRLDAGLFVTECWFYDGATEYEITHLEGDDQVDADHIGTDDKHATASFTVMKIPAGWSIRGRADVDAEANFCILGVELDA